MDLYRKVRDGGGGGGGEGEGVGGRVGGGIKSFSKN